MPDKKKLIMSFDPGTIEHLGVKMYSKLPNAIAELIANAYDADASVVNIKLYDNTDEKKIVVEDDGVGMSFEEINDLFLRIGRNRRKEGKTHSPSGKRKVTGKKGLGKLAFFGIGSSIRVETIKENSGKKISFILEWEELISTHDKDYEPRFEIEDVDKNKKGTTIILTKLQRKSPFDKFDLANSLSKLFNFFDDTFKVYLTRNDDEPLTIDDKLKYENIEEEFKWDISEIINKIDSDYELKDQIKGIVLSTEKPMKPGLRGITLFSNGRMVNAPEFFGVSESSHGYSYFTGWLEADFIDDWEEDVISTHRQSINWELEYPSKLRAFLLKCMIQLEKDWKEKRSEKRRKTVQEKTKVNIKEWYEKIPNDILENLEPIVTKIVEKSELLDSEQTDVINKLHNIIPEYPYYHWRHLHKEIQNASKNDYLKQDYYRAFQEAAKRYINKTREKSGSNKDSETSMMGEVFGANKTLSVTKKYKKRDGSEFNPATKNDIEEGQKFLSMGIVQGGRNPVSHEEIGDLRDSDLFSEKDCLDALSLLSYLMKKLENAEKINMS